MLHLPNHGDRIKVWPMPGRKAQMDERPVDRLGGGRFIPACGAVVEWTPFQHSQYLSGATMLHPPPCEKHDHGSRGEDDCGKCGRTVEEAQKYDVQFAEGKKAADDARPNLPKHPHELGLHPHSEAMKKHREKEAKAAGEQKPSTPAQPALGAGQPAKPDQSK